LTPRTPTGSAYPATRRTEPRIAARIWEALGDARTVLNVGAGTGSYEPPDRDVTAVEPSAVMRTQRPEGAAPCVAADAESLPFEDQSFDAAMAVSTVHHWQDPIAGLREMRRVARRVVVFTSSPWCTTAPSSVAEETFMAARWPHGGRTTLTCGARTGPGRGGGGSW
jgi:ubiquinone/menaquinone biosynthesis C-methylase UbiE